MLVLLVKNCRHTSLNQTKQSVQAVIDTALPNKSDQFSSGFNRHPISMYYSKHAKCRMECRHIYESEIKDILENGSINYRKSELQGEPCRKKYAVEGFSKDGQKLRIIFAPCGNAK
jgi:hypothetical protein